MRSDYRLASPYLVRMMGVVIAIAGALVVLVILVGVRLGWPAVAFTMVMASVLVVVGMLAAALPRLAPVVRLDDVGYEVRWVRGAGVKRGRWKDVEDVVATTMQGARCVVLRRRDGRTTTIPVDILAGSTDVFVRDLQQHLNRGHGYRPVT